MISLEANLIAQSLKLQTQILASQNAILIAMQRILMDGGHVLEAAAINDELKNSAAVMGQASVFLNNLYTGGLSGSGKDH